MATESNLQKIHVFPSEESYEQNQSSIGENDIAFVPDDSSGSGGGIPVVTTGGTGEAFTATVPGVTELYKGLCLILVFNVGSTIVKPTLNVNGLGAKDLVRYRSSTGQTGAAGEVSGFGTNWLSPSGPQIVIYSGSMWVVLAMTKPNARDVEVSIDTAYTTNHVRGIALNTSTPSSIRNGSIVGVYST